MKVMFADMHNHSTFSDGTLTPEEIVALAKEHGFGGVVLSDHDTTQGTYFMQKAARKAGLLSFLGCEITTQGYDFAPGFHLLGYDFNPDEPEMKELLAYNLERTSRRTKLLLERGLEKGTLKDITWEEVMEEHPYNDFICNDHVFRTMLKKGVAKPEDYDTWFRPNFSFRDQEREREIQAIINKPAPHVEDAIRIVRKAGGVPVLAHPHNQGQYIEKMIQQGLMGLEVKHDIVRGEESLWMQKMADEHGLYKTGGGDHEGVLSGYKIKAQPCDASIDEDNFMKLYRRELG